VTSFHFDIGSRARHAGRFIGRVRSELLRALSQRKGEGSLPQQVLAEKLGIERSLINRQLSGESNLTLRALADLAWAMDMEISFQLKEPVGKAGQNQPIQDQVIQDLPIQDLPMTTSTVGHGQIKYINGTLKRVLARPAGIAPEQAKPEQAKKSA
jgi:transcriptional regulator with XRE-family HTH domain